jgi:signal transduction histidine kinase
VTNFNILIVDDIKANIISLESLLTSNLSGINVIKCYDANDALKVTMIKRIDFIISDVQMPNMNGFEFVDILKRHKKTKNIPIIFITASEIACNDISTMKGLELGAIDYLMKPINDSILIAKLKNYIEIFRLQQQIKEKDKMLLEQSNQIIGMIAHQWRQPITNVKLLATSIEMKIKNKDFQEEISTEELVLDKTSNIKSIVNELSETITDFINFFKPKKEKSEVNIIKIIKECIELTSASFSIHDIKIDIDYVDNIIINTYERELKQVIMNIIHNAKDQIVSSKTELKTIDIKVYKNKESVFIDFIDKAGGIEKDILTKIFEPYFSTKSQNGTGLGLYMSKVIINNNLEGELTVKNIDNGAKFTIILPL